MGCSYIRCALLNTKRFTQPNNAHSAAYCICVNGPQDRETKRSTKHDILNTLSGFYLVTSHFRMCIFCTVCVLACSWTHCRVFCHRKLASFNGFYRAMLCIRGTSHGPVSVCLSVCLSVTSQCSTKTTKRRITQTTPHDRSGTLVF